jgi:DNA-binding transcriptional LysR family regulator
MRNLNSLAIFAKIVEAKSFSEAARGLHLPVSTVSRRLAELEDQLGVRLLERSTRSLRVTEVGSAILKHARHSAELCETVDSIIANDLHEVSGTLRLCAPRCLLASLIIPVVSAFRASYPDVRVQLRTTEHTSHNIAEHVDLEFKVAEPNPPSYYARTLLSYRHQIVASPSYLAGREPPRLPSDLLRHRLLTPSFWQPPFTWNFVSANGMTKETFEFEPQLAINDYAVLAYALLHGAGIGELPPIVQPELIRKGVLIEVMPDWHLPIIELTLTHPRREYVALRVRLFEEFATQMMPTLFPELASVKSAVTSAPTDRELVQLRARIREHQLRRLDPEQSVGHPQGLATPKA